jgi:Na+/alanine symporter
MEAMFHFIDVVNRFAWGPPMMILLIGTGIWLTVGTRGVQVRQFAHAASPSAAPFARPTLLQRDLETLPRSKPS